jgi:serine protease
MLRLVLVAALAVPADAAPLRLLVRYTGARPLAHLDGGRALRRITPSTHLVELDERGAARLAADPEVLYVEPDRVRQRCDVEPDDPMYPEQWGLPLVRAPAAWGRTTGSTAVTVAVLDSGILMHPELADRVVAGYDFISDASNAGDGDGRDPDPTDAGNASESSSALHGLHVTGIIGADGNNRVGVAGLDWACRIQPVRVLGVHRGTGVDSDIADALRWAAGLHVEGVPDNATPADVINLSFGGPGLSRTLQEAVDDAIARGATVVAAAGNRGVDAADDSPAALAGVISVGAVDASGRLAAYSNFGRSLALLAPGGHPGAPDGVLSTLESPTAGFTYAWYAGTSQATAFVSASVALMKAVYPALAPDEAERLLMASADPSARCSGAPAACGAGLLDVDAAVALAAEQPACVPRCGAAQLCRGGACVASLAAPQQKDALASGCAAAGSGARGRGLLVGWLLLAAARRRFDARRTIRYS